MYTIHEYADMYMIFGECGGNALAASRLYAERFPQRQHPSSNVFHRLDRRIRDSGSLLPVRREIVPPRRVRVPEVEEQVIGLIEENPSRSTREIGRMLEISHSSVYRILKQENLRPFHYTTVQELLPRDYDSRLEFCLHFINQHEADENFLRCILWTDECFFTKNGVFNSHNMHQWSNVNPHATWRGHSQQRFGVNIWAGICINQLIGPHILPYRLNGEHYIQFLDNNLEDLLEDLPLAIRRDLWFQQDGAPAHYDINVRNWLDANFPERWIGRGGTVAWPPRSPDLTPLDCFLWGFLKNNVYSSEVNNVNDLIARIFHYAGQIRQETLEAVSQNIVKRALLCVEQGGGHIEHLL